MNYIYKITNMLNGKYYIGKKSNSSDPLHDGYLGSGKAIKAAVEKYGAENFKKEILEYCDTIEQLNQREEEIVNEDIVNDPMSYNLMCGRNWWISWTRDFRRDQKKDVSKKQIS